jgi:hypothetical protein
MSDGKYSAREMRRSERDQLDLFRALPGDLSPRDAQDLMAYPFFSLAKSRRIAPIDFRAGTITIRVEAVPEHGMATIWDADILIWAASQIVEALDAGLKTSRLMAASPYEILTFVSRGTSVRDYDRLKAALDRVRSASRSQHQSRRFRFFSQSASTILENGVTDLTTVELLWLEKRIENRIRFGNAVSEQLIDRRRRVLSFAPGSIFAFVRWASNDFGTFLSRIDILRAAAPGLSYSRVPWVKPGGENLLRLSGWPKVERALQLIDAVEALDIDPADVAPDYWRRRRANMMGAGARCPSGKGCHVIADGEVFLMNRRSADSFDGRYFGALPTSSIIGTAEPLWTGEEE